MHILTHQFQIISLVLFRDIFPARDGAGWKNRFLFNLLISYLPTLGILLILLASSLFGLYLITEDQRLAHRLMELRHSPYMALFAEGFFNPRERRFSRDRQEDLTSLNKWQQMTLKDLPLSIEPTDLPIDPLLFKGVFPFVRVSLNMRNANAEHFEGWKGMALAFEGDNSNTALLREIEKYTPNWHIPADNSLAGIIISERTLRELGWTQADIPPFLWVHLANEPRKEYRQDVPIKILAVVKKLPYQVRYVMSLGQFARLQTRAYYRPVKKGFDISYATEPNEKEKQWVQARLPETSQIYGPIKKGEKYALRIDFKEDSRSMTWLEIINQFVVPTPDKRFVTVPITDTMWDAIHYKGGIFHLNPTVLGNPTLAKELPRTLQELMDDQNIRVRGELVQALQEAFQDQRNLEKMRQLFEWGIYLLLGILLIFFSIVLHTRMNRMGILRMLGVSKMAFIVTYLLAALLFVILAFLASLLLFSLMSVEIVAYLYTSDTFWLLVQMSIFAVLGVLLPTLYFLWVLQPSEMLSYSF